MADIKTRSAEKGTIKTLDKASVAASRMKHSYARTKELVPAQGIHSCEKAAGSLMKPEERASLF